MGVLELNEVKIEITFCWAILPHHPQSGINANIFTFYASDLAQ